MSRVQTPSLAIWFDMAFMLWNNTRTCNVKSLINQPANHLLVVWLSLCLPVIGISSIYYLKYNHRNCMSYSSYCLELLLHNVFSQLTIMGGNGKWIYCHSLYLILAAEPQLMLTAGPSQMMPPQAPSPQPPYGAAPYPGAMPGGVPPYGYSM